jgi:hypothetical protein
MRTAEFGQTAGLAWLLACPQDMQSGQRAHRKCAQDNHAQQEGCVIAFGASAASPQVGAQDAPRDKMAGRHFERSPVRGGAQDAPRNPTPSASLARVMAACRVI